MTDPEINPEMDLPALISALPHSGSSKLHLLQQTLQVATLSTTALPNSGTLHPHTRRLPSSLQKFTEEEENHGMMKSAVMEEPQHPQPVAVSVLLTPKSVARTAPPRVSDRVLTERVKLHMYPPVYSRLTGEVGAPVTYKRSV